MAAAMTGLGLIVAVFAVFWTSTFGSQRTLPVAGILTLDVGDDLPGRGVALVLDSIPRIGNGLVLEGGVLPIGNTFFLEGIPRVDNAFVLASIPWIGNEASSVGL
jgi:hypothetical protein